MGLQNGVESAADRLFDWYGIWAWNERGREIKKVSIEPGQWYLYSTYYRTLGATDVAYMRLNNDVDISPATNGEWHRYLGLYCRSSSIFFRPFIFLPAPSNEVWIDGVSIKPIIDQVQSIFHVRLPRSSYNSYRINDHD